jgi:hypothetical protein
MLARSIGWLAGGEAAPAARLAESCRAWALVAADGKNFARLRS